MTSMILRGGTVVDGSDRTDAVADVVIADGMIRDLSDAGQAVRGGATVLDVTGLLVMPGLVDIQVHFREPGGTEAEDIASGAAGAASGGITAVVMMPNTTPAIDTPDLVRDVMRLGRDAPTDVYTSACLSRGRGGSALVDFDALFDAGVRIFTDDGNALMDSALMRQALDATLKLPGAVISQHCEDEALVSGGAVNAGPVADRLGVGGRPAVAEEIIVARDIALARLTGGRYHVLHMSSAGSLALVRKARQDGVRVTCEVTPQHLVLTEDDVERLGTRGKMNPPLRTPADVQALRNGLVGGVIDAVATDHAPHPPHRKALPLADAPPGMLGVETAASVIWTHLVGPGLMTPHRAVQVLSRTPATIAGLTNHGRPIQPGEPANLCVFDPALVWQVDPTAMSSRSRNSPFSGDTLTGRPVMTILAGQPVMSRLG